MSLTKSAATMSFLNNLQIWWVPVCGCVHMVPDEEGSVKDMNELDLYDIMFCECSCEAFLDIMLCFGLSTCLNLSTSIFYL